MIALLDTHEVEVTLGRVVNELSNDGWESTVQKWLRSNPEIAEKQRGGKGSPCDTPNVTTPAIAELAT